MSGNKEKTECEEVKSEESEECGRDNNLMRDTLRKCVDSKDSMACL